MRPLPPFLFVFFFPMAFLCLRQVWRDLLAGRVKAGTGYRTRQKAPGTFWLNIGLGLLVGLSMAVLGILSLTHTVGLF